MAVAGPWLSPLMVVPVLLVPTLVGIPLVAIGSSSVHIENKTLTTNVPRDMYGTARTVCLNGVPVARVIMTVIIRELTQTTTELLPRRPQKQAFLSRLLK